MPEKNFKCLEFDDENKRLNILIGNVDFIDYDYKCQLKNVQF